MDGRDKIKEDKRFAQANREAIYAVILALLYFLWWYVSAYGLGSGPVEEYRYILGLPEWFFFSCIAGFLVFSILARFMVTHLFKEISLETGKTDSRGGDK